MNQQKHKHPHRNHDDQTKGPWKPHRDWRVVGVILMLIAMAIYVLTMNESESPDGPQPEKPAAVGP